MGAILSAGFILFFALVNAFLWGNGGYTVHLISIPVSAYSLVWAWIGMIAIICGCNYAVEGGQKHPVGNVIGVWWTANIGMTTVLNWISYRGVEESGSFFGMSGLILDFGAQGLVDLISILLIWFLIKREVLTASVAIVVFCGYLVANLFGHTAGAYNLMTGVDADMTAVFYDAYMYLIFTIMLLLQAVGAGSDAILRWSGSNVDLYRDIRPFMYRAFNRHSRIS